MGARLLGRRQGQRRFPLWRTEPAAFQGHEWIAEAASGAGPGESGSAHQRQGPAGMIQAVLVTGGPTCWPEYIKRWWYDSESGKGASQSERSVSLQQEVGELRAGAGKGASCLYLRGIL